MILMMRALFLFLVAALMMVTTDDARVGFQMVLSQR
jgi:hypothetical protein